MNWYDLCPGCKGYDEPTARESRLMAELRNCMEARDAAITALVAARAELALALAHDTQPYPTAWAYEQACKALAEKTARLDAVIALCNDWYEPFTAQPQFVKDVRAAATGDTK